MHLHHFMRPAGVLLALMAAAALGCTDESGSSSSSSGDMTSSSSSSGGGTSSSSSSSGGGGACGSLTYYGECNGDFLHYCNDGMPENVDCTTLGASCSLQNSTIGFNCVASSCSNIPSGGQCANSTTFESCGPSGVVTEDCAMSGATCGVQNGATQCITACGNITHYGECSGNTLTYCLSGANNQTLVTVDCASHGRTCGLVNTTDGYDCVAGNGCGAVTETGACNGNMLQVCSSGALVSTDCAASGGTCVTSGGGAGCQGSTGGSRTVTGRITYDKRPATADGLGNPVATASRHVRVEAVATAGDAILAFASTDTNGNYTLNFDAMQTFRVRTITRNVDASYRIDVHDPQGSAYAVSSNEQDASSTTLNVDINVSEANGSGAFNIFDLVVKGYDFIRTNLQKEPVPLEAEWQVGVTPPCGTSCYSGRETRMYILNKSDDTDEFDDAVLLHEFGHYMSDKFSRDDSPGGSHDGSPADPRLAWSEGYGTFAGCSIAQNSQYIDTSPGGASVTDLENTGRAPAASPGSGLTQPIGEYLVGEVLWDIADSQDDTGDTISMGPAAVFDVIGNYFTASAFADRGVEGVDLTDFLDGWFCRGHGQNAGIHSIVNQTRGFPYDNQGPASCP